MTISLRTRAGAPCRPWHAAEVGRGVILANPAPRLPPPPRMDEGTSYPRRVMDFFMTVIARWVYGVASANMLVLDLALLPVFSRRHQPARRLPACSSWSALYPA